MFRICTLSRGTRGEKWGRGGPSPHTGHCEEPNFRGSFQLHSQEAGVKGPIQEGELSLPPAFSSFADSKCFLRLLFYLL